MHACMASMHASYTGCRFLHAVFTPPPPHMVSMYVAPSYSAAVLPKRSSRTDRTTQEQKVPKEYAPSSRHSPATLLALFNCTSCSAPPATLLAIAIARFAARSLQRPHRLTGWRTPPSAEPSPASCKVRPRQRRTCTLTDAPLGCALSAPGLGVTQTADCNNHLRPPGSRSGVSTRPCVQDTHVPYLTKHLHEQKHRSWRQAPGAPLADPLAGLLDVAGRGRLSCGGRGSTLGGGGRGSILGVGGRRSVLDHAVALWRRVGRQALLHAGRRRADLLRAGLRRPQQADRQHTASWCSACAGAPCRCTPRTRPAGAASGAKSMATGTAGSNSKLPHSLSDC